MNKLFLNNQSCFQLYVILISNRYHETLYSYTVINLITIIYLITRQMVINCIITNIYEFRPIKLLLSNKVFLMFLFCDILFILITFRIFLTSLENNTNGRENMEPILISNIEDSLTKGTVT